MEDKLKLYQTFIQFLLALGEMSSIEIVKVKNILKRSFYNHADKAMLISIVKEVSTTDKDLGFLFDECIRICDEWGPSREYFTLIHQFENSIAKGFKRNSPETAHLTNHYLEHFKQEITLINQKIPHPPLFNILLESRSILEWTSIYAIYPFIPKRIKGEGHPVLLIPPYLGDDYSTSFVRRYLTSLGFKTYKWEQGFNLIKSHYIPRLEEKLDDIYRVHGEKVSLVGWSGGGIFSKIMANRHPKQVAQIITIGSPVWGVMDMKTPVNGILEFFRGRSIKERNKRFIEELEPIPHVPITCIYTKTDGLLPWKHCMEAESYREDIKNIEVYGSHTGLGANASVLLIIANALSANINGEAIEDSTSYIERILYPFYWNKKKRNLFFLN